MPMIKLTKCAIDAIPQSANGQVLYRDIDLPSFGIRFGRRSRAYFEEAQVKRRTIRTTIGRYHLMVPEEAWKQARRLLGETAVGNNPNEEKVARRTREPTLRQAFENFLSIRPFGSELAAALAGFPSR
ncbi:MAG: DUF4102 domain-containing protein [Chitinophagaceae bacterium]|nr:MAG: DUF4102 domain-containing protein [Chitinophagaceae bacterium]